MRHSPRCAIDWRKREQCRVHMSGFWKWAVISGFRKWAVIALGSVAALVVAALIYVYAESEFILNRAYPLAQSSLHASGSAEEIARGAHLIDTFGCTDCHGNDVTGSHVADVPPGTTLWSPNLRLLAKNFADADFDRGLRQGLRADKSSVVLMPSEVYAGLHDEDAAAIVSYLRNLPPKGEERLPREIGLIVRAGLAIGMFNMTRGDFDPEKKALDLGPKYEAGRYLAQMSCGQCHANDLKGGPQYGPMAARPDLGVVAAYDREDFRKLMRTGKAAGNRDLPFMSYTAKQRFSHFTDAEIDALYDYLAARGNMLAANP